MWLVRHLDLFLASSSPRRRELLQQAGIRFEPCEPGPEYGCGGGGEYASGVGEPALLAMRRAKRKGEGAQVLDARVPVLAVDTVVDLDGRELGKAADPEAALAMLQQLVGREHRVHTAHYLRLPATQAVATRLSTAVVGCRRASADELQRYVDSLEWRGKAGGYGIQDRSQGFFVVVAGALDTVIGMHVAAVRELLRELGASA